MPRGQGVGVVRGAGTLRGDYASLTGGTMQACQTGLLGQWSVKADMLVLNRVVQRTCLVLTEWSDQSKRTCLGLTERSIRSTTP